MIHWAIFRSPPDSTNLRARYHGVHTHVPKSAAAPFPIPSPSPGEQRQPASRPSSPLPRGTDPRAGEEAMPPGGGGEEEGGEHGSTVQSQPPATVRREEDMPPHSTPQLPTIAPVASKEKKKKQEQEQEQQPVPSLPEGALVEVLSRVPYTSLCRFKCVSKPWLALCSAPDIRKRSPQTLSGFFYYQHRRLNFRNLSGRGPPLVDPSLAFLRNSYEHFYVAQFCDGLLLCSCWNSYYEEERDYVVCNPATKEWTVLPPVVFPSHDKVWSYPLKVTPFVHLGFEAAVPSHFAVFAIPSNVDYDSEEVGIYSSETGQWTYMQGKWVSVDYVDQTRSTRVFLNGTMHLITLCKSIFRVDAEGKVWREIQMPDGISSDTDDMGSDTDDMSSDVYIGRSQGQLYLWHIDHLHDCQLYIWVLEDYVTGKWTLKHTVKVLELFGRHCRKDDEFYQMFAVHPDCNIIFLTDKKNMTLSYDMDNQKVHVISTEGMYGVPYIPCFEELSSAGH